VGLSTGPQLFGGGQALKGELGTIHTEQGEGEIVKISSELSSARSGARIDGLAETADREIRTVAGELSLASAEGSG
jgi:hypothetical protein